MANGDMIRELNKMAESKEVSTDAAIRLMLAAQAGMYAMLAENEARIAGLEKSDKRWAGIATLISSALSSMLALLITSIKGE